MNLFKFYYYIMLNNYNNNYSALYKNVIETDS